MDFNPLFPPKEGLPKKQFTGSMKRSVENNEENLSARERRVRRFDFHAAMQECSIINDNSVQ